MDLDGDGVISMYEMEFFYEEQVEKMEMLGIETLPFQDCLCQVCIHLNHTGTNRCGVPVGFLPSNSSLGGHTSKSIFPGRGKSLNTD